MEHPVGNVVVVHEGEDLGLVNIPRVSGRMKDAVGINGKLLAMPLFNADFVCSSNSAAA